MIIDKFKILIKFNYNKYCYSTKSNLKVVFFGTDLLSIKILTGLNKLYNHKLINEINVITSASLNATNKNLKTNSTSVIDSKNFLVNFRGNQIIDYCIENKIKYHVWSNVKDPSVYQDLFKNFHIGIVASFGHLIPAGLIELFPYGIINVHPSLLPRWRGASPIIYSILFNDKQVGVSIMKILPKHFDIGPLIDQKSVAVPSDMTSLKLLDYLGDLGNEMMYNLFENFYDNIKKSKEQAKENILYAHKITSQMYFIDWSNSTMSEIDCQYRALHEIKPLKTMLNNQVLKLYNMVKSNINDLIQDKEIYEPGGIKFLKNENLIAIKCKDGFVGFRDILLRKKLTAKDFYNGYLNNRGMVKFESVPNTIQDNIHKQKI